jgi:hypothetical protein
MLYVPGLLKSKVLVVLAVRDSFVLGVGPDKENVVFKSECTLISPVPEGGVPTVTLHAAVADCPPEVTVTLAFFCPADE